MVIVRLKTRFGMDSRPQKRAAPARSDSDTSDDGNEPPRGFSLPGGYTELDVLQGRGKGVSKHKGNRRFRKIIKRYNNAYDRAQSNHERRKVVDVVLGEVNSRGRFLEPSKDSKAIWVLQSDKRIREKVSQALRYQQRQQVSGASVDNRSESSSITEEEPASTEHSNNPADTDNAAVQLLGAPTEAEEQEAVQSLNEWEFGEASSTRGDAAYQPLLSDAEILSSIGADHLIQDPSKKR